MFMIEGNNFHHLAIYDVGGFGNMLDINWNGGRLNLFDFNPDPFIRQSFWSLIFGHLCYNFMNYLFDQQTIQRYQASKSRKIAKRALLLNAPGAFILMSLCCFGGLTLYANFAGCDPLTNPDASKRIQNPNQLIPFFVLNNLDELPGIAGLVLGSIFCGILNWF